MLLSKKGHPLPIQRYQIMLLAMPLEICEALRQQSKPFATQNFYEQKEKLANVIHFVKNKIAKIAEKVTIKNEEVEEYKKKNRDEKIKEKAIDNKIVQQ